MIAIFSKHLPQIYERCYSANNFCFGIAFNPKLALVFCTSFLQCVAVDASLSSSVQLNVGVTRSYLSIRKDKSGHPYPVPWEISGGTRVLTVALRAWVRQTATCIAQLWCRNCSSKVHQTYIAPWAPSRRWIHDARSAFAWDTQGLVLYFGIAAPTTPSGGQTAPHQYSLIAPFFLFSLPNWKLFQEQNCLHYNIIHRLDNT